MTDQAGNSDARIGWGTTFKLEKADHTLLELDEVTDIPLPSEEAADVEVTHYKSAGRRKEYRGGLIEPGNGNLVLNYIPGSATDLLIREAHQAGTPRKYEAILPDEAGAADWKISGFLIIKSRGRAVPIGDRLVQTVGVRFTGNSTEAAVA